MTSRLVSSLAVVVCAAAAAFSAGAGAQVSVPTPSEGDFVVRDYTFASGEALPEVRLHYRTVGTPRTDADGVVRNAVLLLHGTGDSGQGLVSDEFAAPLFGKDQPLDAEQYFVIVPDNVGHGRSSKPSDGLRMKFPQYRYTDMVRLQHRLVIKNGAAARLVVGLSMGAMQHGAATCIQNS